MTKSCATCPSFVAASDTAGRFTRSLGVPQCGRFATPLGMPKMPGSKPELVVAETCTSHGEYAVSSPLNYNGLTVAAPDPDHIVPDPDENAWSHQSVNSCTTCRHYVDEYVVERELGWTASGMCKAKGRLIPTNRTQIEARTCAARNSGVNATTTDGIILFPQYQKYVAPIVPRDPFFDPTALLKAFTNPLSYETDKPVEGIDKEIGIRAWRRISDPQAEARYTYLPIFDPDTFPDEERQLIPQNGDDEHPELYQDHAGLIYSMAVLFTELDETPTLWGEPGTGKTELGRHLAWTMSLPFIRVSITASTELDEIAGSMRYTPEQGTYFQPGTIPQAWSKRCFLLVDEPNVGQPPVWHFLRPLTDNSRQLVLPMAGDKRVSRDDNCYLALAMNPAWDPRNRGAEEIADADVSRLSHIFVDLPPEETEREIIARRVALDGWDIGLNSEMMDSVIKVAEEIRGLSRELTIPISWGLRNQIKVARFLRWWEPVTAYRRASADFLEPMAMDALLAVVRSHFEVD